MWTQDDFVAFNIRIVYQDLETFVGVTDLPPPIIEKDPGTALLVARTAESSTSRLLDNSNRSTEQNVTPLALSGSFSTNSPTQMQCRTDFR
jgi:hypothetical protein